MRKNFRFNNAGFTFSEVMAIIIIIAIIAAVALSRIGALDDYDAMGELDKVKSHLRYAQSRAIRTNEVWGINFTSPTAYFLFENTNPATPLRIAGEDETQVTLSRLSVSSAPLTITFDRFGSPGATNITIATSEDNITVTGNTGFVP